MAWSCTRELYFVDLWIVLCREIISSDPFLECPLLLEVYTMENPSSNPANNQMCIYGPTSASTSHSTFYSIIKTKSTISSSYCGSLHYKR